MDLKLNEGMKGKSGIGTGTLLVIGVIGLVAIGFFTGFFDDLQLPGVPGAAVAPGTTIITGGGSGFATSLSVSGLDPLQGAITDSNVEVWEIRADGTEVQVVGETPTDSALTSVSTTLPNSFNGFLMVGNDDLTSGADQGDEQYYTRELVVWQDRPGLITVDRVSQFDEGTLTETGYDDGTIETTVNITVGSGARVTTTELRIEVSADAAFGNPQVNRPIAVCFNETTAGMFMEIKPKQFDSTMAIPGFLSAFNYISPCYVLPISALQEGVAGEQSSYRFGIDIEANPGQNPGNTDNSHAIFLDATYFMNDALDWVVGFEDASNLAADADVGSDNLSDNFIVINFG